MLFTFHASTSIRSNVARRRERDQRFITKPNRLTFGTTKLSIPTVFFRSRIKFDNTRHFHAANLRYWDHFCVCPSSEEAGRPTSSSGYWHDVWGKPLYVWLSR